MKYRVLIISALSFILICICSFVLNQSSGKEIEVNLEYVGQCVANREVGNYWSCIISEGHSISRKLNITIPENDYSNYYLIYSTGKKMIKLTYNTREVLENDKSAYRGYPVFEDLFYSGTVFFYKIPKIKVYPDIMLDYLADQ